MNASESVQRFRISVSGLDGAQSLLGSAVTGQVTGEVTVGSAEARWVPVAVQLPPLQAQRAGSGTHPIEFEIERLTTADDAAVWRLSERSTFIVPR